MNTMPVITVKVVIMPNIEATATEMTIDNDYCHYDDNGGREYRIHLCIKQNSRGNSINESTEKSYPCCARHKGAQQILEERRGREQSRGLQG